MMVVMMMRCALNVVMVVYWLAWAVLWQTTLSSVDWSGCAGGRYFVIRFVMVMVVMMVTVLLANAEDLVPRGTY
jgi:hypothetical protein